MTDLHVASDQTTPSEELSLHELAARIARRTLGSLRDLESREPNSTAIKHVLFELGETCYAIPLDNVLELQRLPRLTALPNVPDWLRGVMNLRGDILSVVDLRSLLGLPAFDQPQSQRLVVVRSTQEEIATGWVVDRVVGVRRLAVEEAQTSAPTSNGVAVRFVRGLISHEGKMVALLDVNRVLSSPEMRQFETTWQADVA